MSHREKIMIFVGGMALFLTAYYLLVFTPAQESTRRLNRMIGQREKEIVQLQNLKKEYQKVKSKFSVIENRLSSISKGFSSLTFLENIAQKSNLRDKITSITPQAPIDGGEYKGTTLEIKMDGVDLAKMVEYIYMVENSEYWMKINRLTLKTKYGNAEKFDARMNVVSFSKK